MNRSPYRIPRAVAALGLACAAMLGGCGYDPTWYQVTAVAGPAQPGGPSPVEIRSVSFPAALDRDQIVTRAGERLSLDSHAAWSEAPGTQIGRALASDLAQRLPGSTVFLQGSAVATEPAVVVELNVTEFSGDAQGQAVLAGTLAVHRKGGLGQAASLPLHLTAPAGAGTQALVGQLSALLGRVADQAAVQIRAMPVVLAPIGADLPNPALPA